MIEGKRVGLGTVPLDREADAVTASQEAGGFDSLSAVCQPDLDPDRQSELLPWPSSVNSDRAIASVAR
jgi:hypothetical protein